MVLSTMVWKNPIYFHVITDQVAAIIEAAIEAFTLHFAIASTSNQGNQIDDLLSVIQPFSKQVSNARHEGGQFAGAIEMNIFSEIYRVLDVGVDYTLGAGENIETLLRYPLAQRCLGMQLSLGYSGEGQQRSKTAKVAWTILNLRHTSLMLLYAIKFHKQENSENKKKGVLAYLSVSVYKGDKLTPVRVHCTDFGRDQVVNSADEFHYRRAFCTWQCSKG